MTPTLDIHIVASMVWGMGCMLMLEYPFTSFFFSFFNV